MEIEELKNKFIPIEQKSVISQLDSIIKGLGMPPSYCRFDNYVKTQNGRSYPILKLLTVHYENQIHKTYETKSSHRPIDAEWTIDVYSRIIRCKPLSNENFWQKLTESDQEMSKAILETFQPWFIGQIIQTPDDGFLHMVNSNNRWPAWMMLATSGVVDKFEENLTARGADNNDFNDFVGGLLGFHPIGKYQNFFPCTAVLINQTLIRIEENRIKSKDNEETVFITFLQNRFGLYHAENSNPTIRYLLTGRDKNPVGHGVIKLNSEMLKNGLHLELSADKKGFKTEIFHAEVGLYLGETLVDRSSAPYIRKINIGFTVT